ncbi:MAG: hypothetical protein OXH36_00455 [Bdellovibrionales bacterium]|nr:hypothetical protein [Bdellovibrionales bacterium]
MILSTLYIMGLSKEGIIIDAEVFHKFVDQEHRDLKPIHKCIEKQILKLVYGNDENGSTPYFSD